jgi:putative membrane protein
VNIAARRWREDGSSRPTTEEATVPKLIPVLLAGGTAVAAALAPASAQAASKLSLQDKYYLSESAEGIAFEIQAGKVALAHASTAPAKALAQRLIADHSAEGTQLRALGAKLHVKLEFKPSTVQKREIRDTAKHHGKAFDRAYVETEIDDHKMDVTSNQTEATDGSAAVVKAFAKAHLPMYKTHLKLARKTAKAIGANPAGS